MKGRAIAALAVLSLLFSSALFVTPVSAKVVTVPQPKPLTFWQKLVITARLIQSDVPDNMLSLITALQAVWGS